MSLRQGGGKEMEGVGVPQHGGTGMLLDPGPMGAG